jgi:hypothetical protein
MAARTERLAGRPRAAKSFKVGLVGSISIVEEFLHRFEPTFVKVDPERSAIP